MHDDENVNIAVAEFTVGYKVTLEHVSFKSLSDYRLDMRLRLGRKRGGGGDYCSRTRH